MLPALDIHTNRRDHGKGVFKVNSVKELKKAARRLSCVAAYVGKSRPVPVLRQGPTRAVTTQLFHRTEQARRARLRVHDGSRAGAVDSDSDRAKCTLPRQFKAPS